MTTRRSTPRATTARTVNRAAPRGGPRRIVIVGAGDCGTRAALALRQAGWNGELTIVGDERETPYERPPLSKAVLTDDRHAPAPIVGAAQLDNLAITWTAGVAAKGIDRTQREVVLADGRHVSYDRLLLATGARARRPAVPGADDNVTTLRSLADAIALRERLRPGTRLVIIGGGFIGLEVAASAVARGCRVTVIEFAHRLMSRVVPAAIAAIVEERHRAGGVDLRCGVGVERIEPRGGAWSVVLTDQTTVVADVLMAGVGVVPNTELAAAAGLAVSNGIAVDAELRTADPAVFAAGDCCSFPHPLYDGLRVRIEAWRNALDHADVAARNMLGDELHAARALADSVPWFWSDQYELGLQIAGLHALAVHDVVRSRDDGAEIRLGVNNDGRVVSASGVATGTAIGRDISQAAILIAKRAAPRPTDLANPTVSLRQLAAAAM